MAEKSGGKKGGDLVAKKKKFKIVIKEQTRKVPEPVSLPSRGDTPKVPRRTLDRTPEKKESGEVCPLTLNFLLVHSIFRTAI